MMTQGTVMRTQDTAMLMQVTPMLMQAIAMLTQVRYHARRILKTMHFGSKMGYDWLSIGVCFYLVFGRGLKVIAYIPG